jgi:hypothetical protein
MKAELSLPQSWAGVARQGEHRRQRGLRQRSRLTLTARAIMTRTPATERLPYYIVWIFSALMIPEPSLTVRI